MQCRSLHTTRLPFKYLSFVFILDKKPATAEKVRLLKETNKPVDLNEFLQHFFRMTMERHHGRNKGRFYTKKNLY